MKIDSSKLLELRSQLRLPSDGAASLVPAHPKLSVSFLKPLLPEIQLGSFLELLGEGALLLAMKCMRKAACYRPAWAVVESAQTFYPPPAAALGLDLHRLILIQTPPREADWAFSQLLRSNEIGAALWNCSSMDNMLFRRLQLAAERGGGLGLVLRPMAALRKPCWGSARLKIERIRGNQLRVTLLHSRGRCVNGPESIEVEA